MDEAFSRIEAQFVWEPKEYARVVQHLSRENMRSPGWCIALALGGGWLLWTLGRLVQYGISTGDVIGTFVGALPWLLLLAFVIWVFRGGSGWLAARKTMKLDPRVDRLQRHVIDGRGLHVDTGSGSMSLPWDGMARVAETDDHFLWYWHAQFAHYTPKRALSDGDLDGVRQLILQCVPDRAQLRP